MQLNYIRIIYLSWSREVVTERHFEYRLRAKVSHYIEHSICITYRSNYGLCFIAPINLFHDSKNWIEFSTVSLNIFYANRRKLAVYDVLLQQTVSSSSPRAKFVEIEDHGSHVKPMTFAARLEDNGHCYEHFYCIDATGFWSFASDTKCNGHSGRTARCDGVVSHATVRTIRWLYIPFGCQRP